jgi:hypothetical protein
MADGVGSRSAGGRNNVLRPSDNLGGVDWPWSSFHRYVRLGESPSDWGGHGDWYGDEFRHAE